MALTTSEEARLQRIETGLAEAAQAIKNLAAKRQLTHMRSLLQADLDAIRAQLASIQSQFDAIK